MGCARIGKYSTRSLIVFQTVPVMFYSLHKFYSIFIFNWLATWPLFVNFQTHECAYDSVFKWILDIKWTCVLWQFTADFQLVNELWHLQYIGQLPRLPKPPTTLTPTPTPLHMTRAHLSSLHLREMEFSGLACPWNEAHLAVTLFQLRWPSVISGHLSLWGKNFEQGQSGEISHEWGNMYTAGWWQC